MFRQALQKTSSIRFRRWSRAKYAVFCSLSSTVTIGRLAVSIADKSLQKAVGVCFNLPISLSSDESPDGKNEKAELEATLLQNQELFLSEITFDSAAACGRKSIYSVFI